MKFEVLSIGYSIVMKTTKTRKSAVQGTITIPASQIGLLWPVLDLILYSAPANFLT